MKRRTLAFALLLALAPTSVAFAQVEDPTTKAARARFQEGVDFFDKGQFENARAAFLQAYALKQHPAVLLNLAQSCSKSNHWTDAAKYFQKYLKESQGLTPAQKIEGERGLAEARGKIGRLDIQAGAGTEIYVDNERAGTAPLAEPLDVDAGAHAVRIKGPEGSSEQRVTVVGGQLLAVKFGAVSPTPGPGTKVEPNPPPPPPGNETNPNPPPGNEGTTANTTNPPPDTTRPTGDRPKTGLFVAIGGGVVMITGFTLAGIFAGLKDAANTKYNDNIIVISNAAKVRGLSPSGICGNPPKDFVTACRTLTDNQNAVNQDATLANAGIVIGVVGAAAVVGGLVWYFVSKPKAQTAAQIQLAPWIGSEARGMSVVGTF